MVILTLFESSDGIGNKKYSMFECNEATKTRAHKLKWGVPLVLLASKYNFYSI